MFDHLLSHISVPFATVELLCLNKGIVRFFLQKVSVARFLTNLKWLTSLKNRLWSLCKMQKVIVLKFERIASTSYTREDSFRLSYHFFVQKSLSFLSSGQTEQHLFVPWMSKSWTERKRESEFILIFYSYYLHFISPSLAYFSFGKVYSEEYCNTILLFNYKISRL